MVNLSHFSTRGSGIELARGKISPGIRKKLFYKPLIPGRL
jgi:hypothetical protein